LSYFVLASRLLIGGVFAFAAVSKLRDRTAFTAFEYSLRRLTVFPAGAAGTAARAVALGEVAVAVLLAIPSTVRVGFAVAAMMLVLFALGIAIAVRRGVNEPCRCFGGSRAPLGALHVGRNIALAVCSAAAAIFCGSSSTAYQLPVTVLVLLIAGAVLTTVLLLDDLAALFTAPSTTISRSRPRR
jgi:uncharacterized membrane protein YphA (DoxX/SURF4 family)